MQYSLPFIRTKVSMLVVDDETGNPVELTSQQIALIGRIDFVDNVYHDVDSWIIDLSFRGVNLTELGRIQHEIRECLR